MVKNSRRAWISTHVRLSIFLVLLCADVLLVGALYRSEPHRLRVVFLNVGQGDAVYIEAPNGNQLLYDSGPPSGAVLRELRNVMPFWDRSIDVIVLSHPDGDHGGGFVDVLRRYRVDLAVLSGATSQNGVYAEVGQSILQQGVSQLVARRGMSIEMGDGVYADVLYPDHDTTNMETNSASIVLRVHYGDTAFLLSGDLPQAQEDYVTELDGSGLHSQVLKAGHHGSRTSSSEEWIQAVSPDTVVVSAGLSNRYGHPHQEVLDMLTNLGVEIVSTFHDGTILFESDGTSVVRR